MKLLIYFSLCLLVLYSSAQRTFDELILSKPFASCENVGYQAEGLMEGFYKRGEIDSLAMFVDYWGEKCGFFGGLIRLQNVLKMRKGLIEVDSIDSSWLSELIHYKGNEYAPYRYPLYMYDHHRERGRYIFLDDLTRKIAQETQSIDEDLSLILDFYSQDVPTFENIRNASDQSRLKEYYNEEFKRMTWYPEFHAAFLLGAVDYTDNLDFIGRRVNLGFILGAKQLRHTYDMVFGVRIGPAQREYSFDYQDTVITHDKWTGIYLGAEYTFDVIRTNRIDVGLSGGIGLEDFLAIGDENDYGEDHKSFHSLNKNAGLVIRLKQLEGNGYAGIQVRYNWTNFKTRQPLQLDGEYFEVRFLIGSIASYFRKKRLEGLE